MYDVKGNLHEVLGSLPAGVSLVAISKFHPNEFIEAAYAEGQRIFGESHEQELAKKVASLPKDIQWHFIGHLQSNKVKYIAPYISMIESVDSLKLLKEINKQAAMSPSILCEVEAPVRMPTWNGLPASCSATALLESSRKVALGTPFGVKPLKPIVS